MNSKQANDFIDGIIEKEYYDKVNHSYSHAIYEATDEDNRDYEFYYDCDEGEFMEITRNGRADLSREVLLTDLVCHTA